MTAWLSDADVARRLFDHMDRGGTDLAEGVWREPVAHYRSAARYAAELELLRGRIAAFCPSAALPETGSYLARTAAGTPLVAVRGTDGCARVFRNACRHRGARVATGDGCAKAFVCRYHGWTYGLDGALRHVPHADAFPGLDQAQRGLVALPTVETHGLVFMCQEPAVAADPELDGWPALVPAGNRLVQATDQELPVNWKVFVESFLEGYHIRSTHRDTFYPVQYDNLNVVEHVGPYTRITFPYRAIERLRARPAAEWRVDGKLTYVYHLFPNVMVATFPHFVFVVAIEPVAIDRTRFLTWVTAADQRNGTAGGVPAAPRLRATSAEGAALIAAGAAEDNAATIAVQEGLASGANAWLEFGRAEGAIQHFHRTLRDALAARGVVPEATA
ncbi:MAG: aromatic ring-hydroxylating dioxygenase subunit alpha [Deltaproteobacteria bacterium]|nr:aromatic ring-hydroxylating dioxygenase subunit alpha [Deltaproteobacteria bacterium]